MGVDISIELQILTFLFVQRNLYYSSNLTSACVLSILDPLVFLFDLQCLTSSIFS